MDVTTDWPGNTHDCISSKCFHDWLRDVHVGWLSWEIWLIQPYIVCIISIHKSIFAAINLPSFFFVCKIRQNSVH